MPCETGSRRRFRRSSSAGRSGSVGTTCYEERAAGLVAAYEGLAGRFNALGVVATVEGPTVRTFYSRPFLVLMADRFADSCFAALEDPWLRSLPPIGGVDQYLDSTDALYPERARRTGGMLTAEPRPTPYSG